MYSVDIDRQFSVTGNESTNSGECTLIENIMSRRIKLNIMWFKFSSGVNKTFHNFLFVNFEEILF